jgi:hypothetical protein
MATSTTIWDTTLNLIAAPKSGKSRGAQVSLPRRGDIVIKQKTRGGQLFILVAIVTAIAGVFPIVRGRSVNVTLIVVAVLWLIVAIVVVMRRAATSGADRD